MRVALLSFNFGQYCIRLANGLSRGADVLLLLPQEQSAPYRFGLDSAVELVELDVPRLRQPVRQARMVYSVLRRIRAFAPDVVHYQAGHLWFNLVWPFYRSYPLVLTIHESRHHAGDRDSAKTPQWIMDLGYRRADRIIVHGEQIRSAVIADLGRSTETIDTVPAVPDIVLGAADPGGAVEGDGRSILFFGRIWPYKGLEYLIRAEPLIRERVPDARIVIAGRGEDLARYRAMMANPDHFEVRNEYISDQDLVELFKRAAVVVLPHVEASISGVVAVAYTFGKPIVATAVGILPEMVEDRHTGLVVPPRDERALADAIAELLQDDQLRRRLGANARQRVETVFDPASVGEQTIAVYEHAIVGRRR
jgi:glycosyltransferase involved in cell wall biosynthesis